MRRRANGKEDIPSAPLASQLRLLTPSSLLDMTYRKFAPRRCSAPKLSGPWQGVALLAFIFIGAAIYGLISFWLNISLVNKLLPATFHESHDSSLKTDAVVANGEVPNRLRDNNEVLTAFHNNGPCLHGWRSQNCYAEVVRMATARQRNGTVVVVVAARGSFDIILNWCISVTRLGIQNYFLVALDDDAYNFFAKRNAPIVQLPRDEDGMRLSKTDVWVQRTFVSYMILNASINVLISDADAVMMKSPFGNHLSYFDDNSFDVISSPSNFPNPRTGELPDECPKPQSGGMEWRHQSCMGWIFLRAKKRMLNFFYELLLPDVIKYGDDQVGFNCAIRRAGAIWREDKWTSNITMRTRTRTPSLKLIMLPAAQYVRNCTEFSRDRERGYGIYKFDKNVVQLYHCKGSHKKANAENNGFWYLQENWHTATEAYPGQTYNSYLTSITASTELT